MEITATTHDQQWLEVTFTGGTTGRFYCQWLRDNIPSGRHQDRGQRTFDINALPEATLTTITHTTNEITVTFGPDDCIDTFTAAWLHQHLNSAPARITPAPTLWNANQQAKLTFADYPTLLADPAAKLGWLREVRDYGFGLLENVPTKPETILEVVNLFGYVRDTNYGPLFEVRVEPNPANLAFTNRGIGMHTDNPYRDPVPGLQLLHCLVNDSDGGQSQLVDGFAVAEKIRQHHADAFKLLTTWPVGFRYRDDATDLQAARPLIELDSRGEVVGLRYNSRSAQTFSLPPEVMAEYYRAYRTLGELLHLPEAKIEFRLASGQLMIFDNQRVLHGRSAYTEGARHLQGCYADKDALHSLIRVLEETP